MATYATANLRTVALVGHGAAGKTSLAEQLLAKSKMIGAAGSVEKGSTISDHDVLEKAALHSLRSSVVHCDYSDTRVHLIDTPGYPDFLGQAIGALDAVETVAVVVSATVGIGGAHPTSNTKTASTVIAKRTVGRILPSYKLTIPSDSYPIDPE